MHLLLYGVFYGQSHLMHFSKQLEMRKRRNKGIAETFVSALLALKPERAFYTIIKLYNMLNSASHY